MEQDNTISLLLVFDDDTLGSLYSEYLERLNFAVEYLEGLLDEDRLSEVSQKPYDAMLICLSNDSSTLKAIPLIREFIQFPLFVILKENGKENILSAYESGSDDVSVMPASPEILACKIKAIIKRIKQNDNLMTIFELGDLIFDSEKQILSINNETIHHLSGKETDVLQLLAANPNRTLEKGFILRKIWKADNYFNGRSLSVYINHLRNILKDVDNVKILSIHGKGYKLVIEK